MGPTTSTTTTTATTAPIFLPPSFLFSLFASSAFYSDEKPALEVDVGADRRRRRRLSDFLLTDKKLLIFTFQEQKTFLLDFFLLVSRFFVGRSTSADVADVADVADADISGNFTFIRSHKGKQR